MCFLNVSWICFIRNKWWDVIGHLNVVFIAVAKSCSLLLLDLSKDCRDSFLFGRILIITPNNTDLLYNKNQLKPVESKVLAKQRHVTKLYYHWFDNVVYYPKHWWLFINDIPMNEFRLKIRQKA